MEQNKQQACSLPGSAGVSGWLKAYAQNAEKDFAWIHLVGPYVQKSRLGRGLADSGIKMLRCVPYSDGSSAVLVIGPKGEIERIKRLDDIDSFVPECVNRVWVGALPVPVELKELSPIWEDRCIEIFASESVPGQRKPSLLDVVSVDAEVRLEHAVREPVAIGVSSHIVGSGRIEALMAIEELYAAGLLPSKERGSFVKHVEIAPRMNARGSLPKGIVDRLQVVIEESSIDQLRPLLDAVSGLAEWNLSVWASELYPEPGRPLGASIDISMKRLSDQARAELEQLVRKVANSIGAEISLSWQYDIQRS